MAARFDIDVDDLNQLVALVEYAAQHTEKIDPKLSVLLKGELMKIRSRIENERFGCDEASEIDRVLTFIGGGDAQRQVLGHDRSDPVGDSSRRSSRLRIVEAGAADAAGIARGFEKLQGKVLRDARRARRGASEDGNEDE